MSTTLYTTLTDQRVAAVLSGQVLLLLAARGSLPMHPAMLFGGDTRNRGSNTLNFPHVGMMGYDLMDGQSEVGAIVPQAITDAVSTLTPRRLGKAYEASDLARFTDSLGLINAAQFAADAVATFQATQLSLLSSLLPSFTAQVGATNTDLDGATHLGARIALEMANVRGPYLAVYDSRQIGDLAQDAEANGTGAFQWTDDARRVLTEENFAGRFLGADVFRSNHVTNDGTDRFGGMFGRGAIVWGACGVDAAEGDSVALGPYILFERDREALASITRWVQSCYLDFKIAIDDCGVEVLSDF